jgi:hypothetical protein
MAKRRAIGDLESRRCRRRDGLAFGEAFKARPERAGLSGRRAPAFVGQPHSSPILPAAALEADGSGLPSRPGAGILDRR